MEYNLFITGTDVFGLRVWDICKPTIGMGLQWYRISRLNTFLVVQHRWQHDRVWVWGLNQDGQLGIGIINDFGDIGPVRPGIIVPDIMAKKVVCGNMGIAIIDFDDILWLSGNRVYLKQLIGNFKYDGNFINTEIKIKDIVFTNDALLIIDIDDNLYRYTEQDSKIYDHKVYYVMHDHRTTMAISLGYTPKIKIDGKTVFIIDYQRLVEKLRNHEIKEYNIPSSIQPWVTIQGNTMVLF